MREGRHGGGHRVDHDPRRRPADGFRARDGVRFRKLTDEALAALPEGLLRPLREARVQVRNIPSPGDVPPPLAQVELARPGRPATVVVYRRPLELRARDRTDLEDLIRRAVSREVARALGRWDLLDDEDW